MKISAVILAAGLGKRMKQAYPKVLSKLADKELIIYVLDAVTKVETTEIILVVGYKGEDVKALITPMFPKVKFANQPEQLGTGHAVICARDQVLDSITDILVLCGDTPMISSNSLQALFDLHSKSEAEATILTADLDDPTGYGRIIRDSAGDVVGITEQADASDEVKKVKEINSGIYIFKRSALLDNLSKLKSDNNQGEYYLTDIIKILFNGKKKIAGLKIKNPDEIIGINTIEQLSYLENLISGK